MIKTILYKVLILPVWWTLFTHLSHFKNKLIPLYVKTSQQPNTHGLSYKLPTVINELLKMSDFKLFCGILKECIMTISLQCIAWEIIDCVYNGYE